MSRSKRLFWEKRSAKVELFASKIVALLSRTDPRDLYDIHNMIKQSVFSDEEKELLKKCVVFYRVLNDNAAKAFNLSVIDALIPLNISVSKSRISFSNIFKTRPTPLSNQSRHIGA